MKRTLLAFAVMLIALCACKKSEQPGSLYTDRIDGTRAYYHTGAFSNPPYTVKNYTDTVSISIQFVNSATIKVMSYTLTYDPSASTDSTCTYTLQNSGYSTTIADLTYNFLNDSTMLYISYVSSANANGFDRYQSL